ncbi:MAG: NadS family protein [Oleiphilus sp.]
MDDKDFNELLASVQEMDNIVKKSAEPSRITEFAEPEVKSIRDKIGLSQTRFAGLIGVSKRTLENWEQGRRHPTGPARALLRILDKDPESAVRALHS